MFAGFNLNIDEASFKNDILSNESEFNLYKNIGEDHLKTKSNQCKKDLNDYILNGIIDGTKLGNNWFPKIKADIFISHSHKDKDLAVALAGWVYKNLNLECFIDSYVWGHIDELLSKINNEFSDKREDESGRVLYSHEKANKASAHVNIILNMALQKMIDNTEAVFLINTENSIKKYSELYQSSTFSPWIYSEIICTEIIRKKELIEYRPQKEIIKHSNEDYKLNNELLIDYKVVLDHLSKIDCLDLLIWKKKWELVSNKSIKYSLDELYKLTNINEMKRLKLNGKVC